MNSTKPRILITGSESLFAKYLTAQLMGNYELILTYHQSQPKKKQQNIQSAERNVGGVAGNHYGNKNGKNKTAVHSGYAHGEEPAAVTLAE